MISQLDATPDLLNAEDPHDLIYCVPLLAFGVAGGHAHIVELLLNRGAVVAPYSAQLLHIAVMASRMDLIDLLITYGADMRAVDSGIFVLVSDMQTMHFLLNHGASATAPGKNRCPPLAYLSRGDKGEHPDKIQMLLDYGAIVNAGGPDRRTALHYAATAGYLKVISILLDHGADVTLKDHRGNTALDLAGMAGKTAAAALLEQRGAAV